MHSGQSRCLETKRSLGKVTLPQVRRLANNRPAAECWRHRRAPSSSGWDAEDRADVQSILSGGRAAHLFGDNEIWFRLSELNCTALKWKPSFCPGVRDYPVAFGYRNWFAANRAVGHRAASPQVIVEVVIKTKLVPISHRLGNFSLRLQKLQWQTANRHQTGGPHNGRRADQGGGSSKQQASTCHCDIRHFRVSLWW